MTVTIAGDVPDQPAVRDLLAARDAEMSALYDDGLDVCYVLSVSELANEDVLFFVARLDGRPVGTGALLVKAPDWAEMKSVYVSPEARGHGVATALVERLETCARERGYGLLRLETGIRQHAAIDLYKARGYMTIPPFGSYTGHPMSMFMEKRLD